MNFTRSLAFVLAAVLALPAVCQGLSIPVDATISRKEGETNAQLGARTRWALFSRAVTLAAPTLLPGTLSQTRRELLDDFLLSRADDYVLGYSEGGRAIIGDEMVATATVDVDEAGLERLLTHLGVACTIDAKQEYVLELGAGAANAGQDLNRLNLLSGLVPASPFSERTEPLLRLDNDGERWTGELVYKGRVRMAQAEKLDDAWLTLWSGFFEGCGANGDAFDHVEVVVAGFATPDQPLELHEQLPQILAGQAHPELVQISATGGELTAVWAVSTAMDSAAVKRTWEDALRYQGLRVVNATGGAHENHDAEVSGSTVDQ